MPCAQAPPQLRDAGVHFPRGTSSVSTGHIKTRLVGLSRKDVTNTKAAGGQQDSRAHPPATRTPEPETVNPEA